MEEITDLPSGLNPGAALSSDHSVPLSYDARPAERHAAVTRLSLSGAGAGTGPAGCTEAAGRLEVRVDPPGSTWSVPEAHTFIHPAGMRIPRKTMPERAAK